MRDELICQDQEAPDVARFQRESFGLDDAAQLIEDQQFREPDVPGTWFQMAIVERGTERMVGDCGLHCRLDDPRVMEFGITLAPSYQDRGYATEALECLLPCCNIPPNKAINSTAGSGLVSLVS